MRNRSFVVILIVSVALIAAAFTMHGQGHQLLKRWLPAMHGSR